MLLHFDSYPGYAEALLLHGLSKGVTFSVKLSRTSGSLKMYADDERTREAGQTHSTGEVSEQGRATGGGRDGGKGFDQGKSATAKRVPDSEPDRCAQRAGADTSISK
jgi:hypothetical protein